MTIFCKARDILSIQTGRWQWEKRDKETGSLAKVVALTAGLRIPAKPTADSEGKPNGIPG